MTVLLGNELGFDVGVVIGDFVGVSDGSLDGVYDGKLDALNAVIVGERVHPKKNKSELVI